MSLEATINEDIKTAMKAGDKLKLEALRAVKAAIIIAKTDKGATDEMSKETEIALLNKLVKTRKESYDLYVQNNRPDLADVEKAQMDAISVYLPAQMSDEDLAKGTAQKPHFLLVEPGMAILTGGNVQFDWYARPNEPSCRPP